MPWCVSSPGRRLNKPGISGRKVSCKMCTGTASLGTNGHSGPRDPLEPEWSMWCERSTAGGHCSSWRGVQPLCIAPPEEECSLCALQGAAARDGPRCSHVAAGGNLGEHRPLHVLGWELSLECQLVPRQAPRAVRPCPKFFLYCRE